MFNRHMSAVKQISLLTLSAVAMICLQFPYGYRTRTFIVTLVSGIVVNVAVLLRLMPDWKERVVSGRLRRTFLLLSSVGVCEANAESFYPRLGSSAGLYRLLDTFLLAEYLKPVCIGLTLLGILMAVPIVFFYLSVFWRRVGPILRKSIGLCDITSFERCLYGLLIFASFAYVFFCFSNSCAFYDTSRYETVYDVIYTSDSTALMRPNAYLMIAHPENDLRQPLFAVFSAPFIGLPYLVTRVFPDFVRAAAIDCVQVLMLLAANLIVARMMELDPVRRACFVLLSSCTYTYMLFSIMMEQYIFAYFWLVLLLHQISRREEVGRLVFCAAGGSLLTSAFALPLSPSVRPVEEWRKWLKEIISYLVAYITLIIMFGRTNIIISVRGKVEQYSNWTGVDLSLLNRIRQYSAYVKNCFIAPYAGIDVTAYSHSAWLLRPISQIDALGMALFVVSCSARR